MIPSMMKMAASGPAEKFAIGAAPPTVGLPGPSPAARLESCLTGSDISTKVVAMRTFNAGDRVRLINNYGYRHLDLNSEAEVIRDNADGDDLIDVRFDDGLKEVMLAKRFERITLEFHVFGPEKVYLGVAGGNTIEQAFQDFHPLTDRDYTLIPVDLQRHASVLTVLRLVASTSYEVQKVV